MAKPFHHPAVGQLTLTGILHALSDPIRRQIVMRLMETKCLNCNKSCTALSPSTLSFHFRVLREAGLVYSEKNGTSVDSTLRRKDVESRFPGLLRAVMKHHEPLEDVPAPKRKKK